MSSSRPARVLVIDDEEQIRTIIRRYLEADGFEVSDASDGERGLQLLRERLPDLVILDVMMPGIDGIEVLRRLRAESDVYVIMVTARADEVDTLVGLSVGADDYVTKPFSARELVARVKTVLRRSRVSAPAGVTRVEAGDVVIDPDRREVTRAGVRIELTTLEFDLLHALARVPGRVFTRRQLLEQVWGWDFYGDERVVDVHIRAIRKALGDTADAPELVGTVRGVGYRFLGGMA